jgi:DNA-binding NarL/FixJ family response regulator
VTGSRTLVCITGANDIVAGGLRALLASATDVDIVDGLPGVGTVPDVIVYDAISVEADGGAELFALIKESESAVLVLGRDLRPDLACRAMAHGAAGCVSIEAGRDEVLDMIRRAADGGLADEHPSVLTGVLGAHEGLSKREVEVLGEITRGASNADIAGVLALSPNTVKSYIRSAYRKIDATNRSQAVAWCLMHGFEPPAT